MTDQKSTKAEEECKFEMKYNHLGPTGLKVSALSYGNMYTFEQVGVEGSLEIMKYLVDNGVNYFDTAEFYGQGQAETILGEAIALGVEKQYWKRSDLVISTKIFWGSTTNDVLHFPNATGLSRKHIIEGLIASLKRLKLTYVDVVFCHRPDTETPIEETVRAMNWLIDQGKAFYWGTSEWSADQIHAAHRVANCLGLIGPVVEQVEYSLLYRQRFEQEYSFLYKNPGLGTTVWGALASGFLSGKYNDGIPEDSRLKNFPFHKQYMESKHLPNHKDIDQMVEVTREIGKVATELGCTTTQLAYAWVLKNPNTSTILMGGRLHYLKENLGAIRVMEKLTPEVLERIDKIVGNTSQPEVNWKTLLSKITI